MPQVDELQPTSVAAKVTNGQDPNCPRHGREHVNFHTPYVDAIVKLMSKLVRARFNVTAVDAVTAGAGRFGAILRVKQRDVNRVVRALGA